MPQTIQYSNNPNSDTAFVVQDGGQKNRAVLTAEPAGTLTLSDSANVSTGYVTDEDGKKHKVNLVAQLEGDIEFSENPNSTKGYATVDGKKHRVVLTASLHGGGSAPVIDELNVTPTTSAQTITAPSGTDGYSPVNVSAVTSAIDANIVAGNIKKNVSILGVTGSYEGAAPAYYIEKVSNNGKLESIPKLIDLTGITDLDSYVLAYQWYNAIFQNTNLDFSGLRNLSGSYCLKNAFMFSNVTSANFSGLQTITGMGSFSECFQACSGLTSIDFSSLTSITAQSAFMSAFQQTGLTSVSFPALATITEQNIFAMTFFMCNYLTSISFPALTSASFGSQTTQFQNMLIGVTGCTIHFPSNLDPQSGSTVISSLTGYPDFGGTNTVLAFDLPATE